MVDSEAKIKTPMRHNKIFCSPQSIKKNPSKPAKKFMIRSKYPCNVTRTHPLFYLTSHLDDTTLFE